MEVNRKRNGFMKGKLVMSFSRAAKPTSTVQYRTSKLKPCLPPCSTASVDFVVNQDRVTHQLKKNGSFVISENTYDLYGKFDNPYGVPEDESVDAEAASYISNVRERFRLERVNSDHKKSQDLF